MLDAERMQEIGRETAMRYMLTSLYRDFYLYIGFTPEQIAAKHKNIREGMRTETFPGASAELSDSLAAEIERGVDEILRGIEEMLAGLPKQ
jgi:hypothetical protein